MKNKIHESAKCWSCGDRVGRPEEVIQRDGKMYTVYKCVVCESTWLRPHNG